jgi:hypothetical protein
MMTGITVLQNTWQDIVHDLLSGERWGMPREMAHRGPGMQLGTWLLLGAVLASSC